MHAEGLHKLSSSMTFYDSFLSVIFTTTRQHLIVLIFNKDKNVGTYNSGKILLMGISGFFVVFHSPFLLFSILAYFLFVVLSFFLLSLPGCYCFCPFLLLFNFLSFIQLLFSQRYCIAYLSFVHSLLLTQLSFKGTQDWDFFGFDFEICIISLLFL